MTRGRPSRTTPQYRKKQPDMLRLETSRGNIFRVSTINMQVMDRDNP